MSIPVVEENNLDTTFSRLRAIWLFKREEIRSIANRNDLNGESVAFFLFPGLFFSVLWIIYVLVLAFGSTNQISFFLIGIIILAPIVPVATALIFFIISTLFFIKLTEIGSDSVSIKPIQKLNVFSYVYFSRIFLVISFLFQWFFRQYQLAGLIQIYTTLIYIVLYAYTMRSLTKSSISGTLVMTISAFLLYFIPYLLSMYFILGFLNNL